jgi:hypothetical protein
VRQIEQKKRTLGNLTLNQSWGALKVFNSAALIDPNQNAENLFNYAAFDDLDPVWKHPVTSPRFTIKFYL